MKKYPLAKPYITKAEEKEVLSVLRSGILSLGPKVAEFEKLFAKRVGRKYACAVSSGTAGLHLAMIAAGIGSGDEVITTPFSFVASANCIMYVGAKPVFVDIDPVTYNIDPKKIEAKITKNTKAILVVHIFGQSVDVDPILALAKKYKLKIIEDACESINATYKKRKVGTFGESAVFAFYPNKQMTTGEGGVIVTDNAELAMLCRSLRSQGRGEDNTWLEHTRLGFNYRLDEMSCALGLAQLDRIDQMLAKREKVAQRYNKRLCKLKAIKALCEVEQVRRSWFVYVVQLSDSYSKEDRDRIMRRLNKRGIGCQNYFPPIHLQPFYRRMFDYAPGDFPVTERASARTLALPFFNKLSQQQISYVVDNLAEVLL